ncbi:MAG TPA: ATP-binding protein [Bacteroidota bacterium]|jgi:PAS domain S-box-containing protein|nr:ATP-binding protein [Bacteroidota bacterium]
MLQKIPCLCIIAIVCNASAQGQTTTYGESWRWVHFTSESGLPSNQSLGINETPDGTIWSNFQWFDGFSWRNVEDAGDQVLSYTGARPGFDSDGLVAIQDGRVCYRIDKKKITRLLTLDFSVSHFVVMNADSLLLAGEQGPLFLYTHGAVEPFTRAKNLENKNIVGLMKTKSGRIYANVTDGIYRFERNSWKLFLPSSSRSFVLAADPIICENRNGFGCTYISLPIEDQGIWTWDKTSKPKRLVSSPPFAEVISFDISPSNELITIHDNGEVRLWNDTVWQRLRSIESQVKNISRIKFRDNGDVWVARKDELHLCRSSLRRWNYLVDTTNADQNYVHEILRARDGSLWLGTRDGIAIIMPDGSRKSVHRIRNQQLHSITGLGEDKDGKIWISSGANFDGAYRWDGKEWEYFPILQLSYGTLIHKIEKDRQGNLWFLGIGDAFSLPGELQPGAFRYIDGKFERWDVRKGLLHGRVYDVAEGPDGSFWFAMKGGISRWKPGSASVGGGSWQHWTTHNGINPNTHTVFCIAVGPDSAVWFGHSTEGGLGKIDVNGKITYLTKDDGLVYDGVRDIRIDGEGKLWISTQYGIASYSDARFVTYGERTGLIPPRAWPIYPEAERILVGTNGGGVAILDRNQDRSPLPQITIDPARTVGSETILEWKSLAYWSEIPPSELLTRFRLGESSWSTWSTARAASFSGLSHGEHTFTVQAKGLFGQYDSLGVQSSFMVLPPLYFRPGVLMPGIAALLGIVGLSGMHVLRKRKYDRSIRESEERYRMITELMSDYAYLGSFDVEGNMSIVWLTDSFTRVTGYAIAEAKAPGFFEKVVYHEDIPDAVDTMKQLLTGVPREVEGRIVTKQGTVLWMRNYAIPIFDKVENRVTHIYGIARDITQRKHDEQQLRRLATELSRTEEQERRRMANFLHDSISQSLLISKMKLESLRQSKDISVSFEKAVSEVSKLLQQSIENSRSLTFDLCPPILYDLGLAPAVDWLVEQMKEAHALNVEFADDGKTKLLANEMRNTMYTGAREALMNIVKHAGAKNVWVDVRCVDGEVVLAIEDDGIGFDARNRGAGEQYNGGGFGLTNLRERMNHLGGRFEIESAAGKGTRLTLAGPAVQQSHDERTGQ